MLTGRPLEVLQKRLGERYSAQQVMLTGSGTQALTLALQTSVPKGRTPLVALPAYSCFDLVSAAVGADARILFYDVDATSLSPSVDSLGAACDQDPDAVVVSPLYGIPVDWDVVRDVVAPSGALLVEDAAQGLGATWRGRPLGSLGHVSILSFGRGKGWTGGIGGAILGRDGVVLRIHSTGAPRSNLAVTARATTQCLFGRPSGYWLPSRLPWLALGETAYHPPEQPEALPDLAASILLAHEGDARRECEARRRNAAALLEFLEDSRLMERFVPFHPPDDSDAGYLRLPLLTRAGTVGFHDKPMVRQLGIMPGYPRALPDLAQARARVVSQLAMPGARHLARCLVTLPTHHLVTPRDRRRIENTLRSYAAT